MRPRTAEEIARTDAAYAAMGRWFRRMVCYAVVAAAALDLAATAFSRVCTP